MIKMMRIIAIYYIIILLPLFIIYYNYCCYFRIDDYEYNDYDYDS